MSVTATPPRAKPAPPRPLPAHVTDRATAAIPAEIRNKPRWLVWRWHLPKGETKWKKPPIDPLTGKFAKNWRDPKTFLTFEEAKRLSRELGDGIGYRLDDGEIVIDCDHCFDANGKPKPEAKVRVEAFKSYSERSPSGDGLHIVIRGKKPTTRCRVAGIEVYDHASNYITFTGRHLDGTPKTIEHRQEALDTLYAPDGGTIPTGGGSRSAQASSLDLSDDELLAKARQRDPEFGPLFNGDTGGRNSSSADMALMNKLAFWTGRDAARMERLFAMSKLGERDKWTGRADYRQRTIAKAIAGCEKIYTPWIPPASKPSTNGKSQHPPTPPAISTDGDDRPEIEVNTERHLVRNQAVEALARAASVFHRGNVLVMVVRPPKETVNLPGDVELREARGAPRIVPLDEPNLGCLLTENAKFFRWSKDKNGEEIGVDLHPPDWLIKAVLAKGVWPRIRPLLTVTECPYVQADGTVTSKAGYDPTTKALVLPTFDVGKIPARPTRKDAAAAAERLRLRIVDFPFGDVHDWISWLTAFLTAIQRPAIAGPVPGFAFNGNKAGCGKGLLIDLIGILVWGSPVPTVSYPQDPVEADKVALALALGGVQAVHFDNLEEGQSYGGSALDSALTSTIKGGRMLGMSKHVDGVPLRPCWYLSGNNISPWKDAYRRWIPSELRTELEAPHERDDVQIPNIKSHFAQHREEIVADALIILKAHSVAGRPSHGKGPLGSFDDWDALVRAAVWYATGKDCLTTQRRAADESPDRLIKLALIEAWMSLENGMDEGYTVQEVLALAATPSPNFDQLRNALLPLGTKGKFPDSERLGKKLRSMKRTNFGGRCFAAADAKRHQAVVWVIREVERSSP